jgi:LmbE family N-acetylglucosaminyl deacetylase
MTDPPPSLATAGTRLVVLSPHLDDAVLSLGAALRRAARAGADVSIVTVFAGDPEAAGPASPWDRRGGFTTAGEAARGRRSEDRRACAALGVTPIWLPFGSETNERGGGDSTVWAAILETVGTPELVLVPGFPLRHNDHRWLTRQALARGIPAARLGLYVEQPYTLNGRDAPGPPPSLELGGTISWEALPAGITDRLAKVRAMRAYRSQLKLIARLAVPQIMLYELRHGGEQVAWLAQADLGT